MDKGTKAADRSVNVIEKRLRRIYQAAYNEVKQELTNYAKRFKTHDAQMQKLKQDGKISEDDYANWKRNQVFIGKAWKAKVDNVADMLLNANKEAMRIVNGERVNVFAENVNFISEKIGKESRLKGQFDLYDANTVNRLIKEEPELLPRKIVNGKKDEAWNRRQISNAVTQGIIQGDDIPTIAKRIADQTASSNMKAMTRYARTAMTGAQNAGRIEGLHRAQDMGIRVKKKWQAAMDRRTRHSHALLDGQERDIDEPFNSILGEIMYPGDPNADDPGDIYNCRCTLTYVYPDLEE